ncbi:hypothetical protein FACS189454_09650 [Planctomycetales bacterium]|nr:hypothetical protein FACS189454_09650 [Planctomycetales bacterium]
MQRCICKVVVVVNLVLCTACLFVVHERIAVAENTAVIDVIRKDVLAYIRSIHSLEYEIDDDDGSGKNGTRHLKYWQQGNMFRGESFSTKWEPWISTYNGVRYQIFFKEREMMSLKNTSTIPSPTRVIGPPVIAFAWLAKSGMTFTWSDLTSEKNVNEHFLKAKYIGEEYLDSNVCTVLEFAGVIEGSVTKVWFSKGKSNFPIKTLLSMGNHNTAETTITSFESVQTDDGVSVLTPTGVAGMNNFNQSKPAVIRKTSVVQGTLKVNKKYDEDFFTLPTTLAKTVNDIDKLEKEGLLTPTSSIEVRQHSYFWLVVVNGVVIAMLLCRLLLRKRK